MIRFDSRDEKCKRPFGAAAAGCETEINIFVSRKEGIYDLSMLLFRDGETEAEEHPAYFTGLQGSTEVYRIKFCPEEPGLYRYRFVYKTREGTGCLGKGAKSAGEKGSLQAWQLTVYGEDFETPEWIKGGIMYQIFPDRFFRSSRYQPQIRDDSHLREDWGGTPEFIRYEDGSVPNNDFFGGNLDGIAEKLDYLKSLNVNCIYLNPVFEAASNHKYDTGDYEKIDRGFGTEETFRRLCEKAGEKGIRIILDGVFSHTGADSRYFNKEGRYPGVGAFQSKDSEYYSWYSFDRWPDSYKSWWGVKILPEVREEEPSYLEYITGKNGILAGWMRKGAYGYRLDVADELPDIFLDRLRERVKSENPEALIIGEVWEDASNKVSYGRRRRYLTGRQLDSVMNYVFRTAVINFVKYGDGETLAETVESISENYPPQVLNCLMNILGTHDTARILTELETEDRLKCAAVIQYFLPGVPCIFYGDEAGMRGEGDPFCRGCYPWGREDRDLLEFYRVLGRIRRENNDILKDGKYFTNYVNQYIICYRRSSSAGDLFVIVNASGKTAVLNPEDMGINFPEGEGVINQLNGRRIYRDTVLNAGESAVFRTEVRDYDEKKNTYGNACFHSYGNGGRM